MHDTFIATSINIAQLTALIAKHYPAWQACFLNNDDKPILGILPTISWCVYHDDGFMVHQYSRQHLTLIKKNPYPSDLMSWQNELIEYIDCQQKCHTTPAHHTNGIMGFIGYDISANHLNNNITIKKNQPCGYMGHYDIYIKPHQDGMMIYADDLEDELFQEIKQSIENIIHDKITSTPCQLTPYWQKSHYQSAFKKTQAYIKAGDTYQINLTQGWQGQLKGNLGEFLPVLTQKINAPFAGFLKIDDFELLSVSPELFFTFYQQDNHHHIITKPIKGTRPRHHDKTQDDQLKKQLQNSQKDISENLMIVDLLRNDLGKYATIGKVKTPVRFAIESFSHVHHMVSTITAQLQDDIHPLAVLFGSLPAGSITGTPKKRSCEIIHELEYQPRGAYCGTMGLMNFDGTGQWNVLIRTVQAVNRQAELWAGGGVTVGSNCDDEYQECLDKVGAIMEILAQNLHDK